MKALFKVETRDRKNLDQIVDTYNVTAGTAAGAIQKVNDRWELLPGEVVTGVQFVAQIQA